MKIGHTIDANGFLTGDVLKNSGINPPVKVLCPDGFYKPRWNGSAWVEGLTQAEIDAIRNEPQPPTQEEQIASLKARLAVAEQLAADNSDISQYMLEQLLIKGVIE